MINFDIDITENARVLEIEKELFSSYEPPVFTGSKSLEVKNIKAYEDTKTIIESELGTNVSELTVLQFYNKLEFIKERNKQQQKKFKR